MQLTQWIWSARQIYLSVTSPNTSWCLSKTIHRKFAHNCAWRTPAAPQQFRSHPSRWGTQTLSSKPYWAPCLLLSKNFSIWEQETIPQPCPARGLLQQAITQLLKSIATGTGFTSLFENLGPDCANRFCKFGLAWNNDCVFLKMGKSVFN